LASFHVYWAGVRCVGYRMVAPSDDKRDIASAKNRQDRITFHCQTNLGSKAHSTRLLTLVLPFEEKAGH
jgi:hypothetical protein